jgi:hypothetical protein
VPGWGHISDFIIFSTTPHTFLTKKRLPILLSWRIWVSICSPTATISPQTSAPWILDRWYTFDPTQTDLQGGRVAIAFGRDAADVAIYTQFGDPVALFNMHVTVKRMPGPPGRNHSS